MATSINETVEGKEKIANILEEIAINNGINFTRINEEVFYFERSDIKFCVYANNWPHNSSSGYKISWDKESTFKILNLNNIKSIDQIYIQRSEDLVFDKAKAFFLKHQGSVVLKDNFGVNGRSVVFCENDINDFQKKLLNFLTRYGSVNISKKIDIVNEFRCIVLCGNVELIYLKKRPTIIGDGISPLITLLAKSQFKILKLKSSIESNLYTVPEKDTVIELSDQDNLSLGAEAEIIQPDNNLFSQLKDIALRSANALDLNFCSIDIVLNTNGVLLVMEANSGMMFNNFVIASNTNEVEVKRIFNKAIALLIK